MRRFHLIWTMLLLTTIICQGLNAQEMRPAQFPSLITGIDVEGPLDFCGEPLPLDIPEVRERLEKELLLTLWNRPQVILWLKRSGRFMPYIEGVLRQNQMPLDLKYVAVIESALRPHAQSSKGAVGFWQFIKTTGRRYGLRIDRAIDQRRSVFASTKAAAAYLKELYHLFGSWTLAVAAYNMGEEGLKSEILTQKTKHYYQLYMPLETQRYVFKIVAAKLILSNPEKYGYQLSPEQLYTAHKVTTVTVQCKQDVPIQILAEAAGTYFKTIKDLNPEIRGYYLVKGEHQLLVPAEFSDGFDRRYRKLMAQAQKRQNERIYVVRRGDSLSSIAEHFNIPLPALLITNKINPSKPIHPGNRIKIPDVNIQK